jgi:hypothetical protein
MALTKESAAALDRAVKKAKGTPRSRGTLPRYGVNELPEKANRLERAYATELELKRLRGSVLWWGYEIVSIPIGPGARYRPDFLVVVPWMGRALVNSGSPVPPVEVEFHETKGFMREAARVRLLVAIDRLKWARFLLVRSDGEGRWKIEVAEAGRGISCGN